MERAFDHLVNFTESAERDVRFHVTCGLGNNKGILIRGGLQDVAREYAVTIEPVFADTENVGKKNYLYPKQHENQRSDL